MTSCSDLLAAPAASAAQRVAYDGPLNANAHSALVLIRLQKEETFTNLGLR
jgi:hypothetical protein